MINFYWYNIHKVGIYDGFDFEEAGNEYGENLEATFEGSGCRWGGVVFGEETVEFFEEGALIG
jgi:hypothetical protein